MLSREAPSCQVGLPFFPLTTLGAAYYYYKGKYTSNAIETVAKDEGLSFLIFVDFFGFVLS
jgi:hypothetical protein